MLLQIIGPPGCGKTELIDQIASKRTDIGMCLGRMFNSEMLKGGPFYFQEKPHMRGLRKLQEWITASTIRIDIQYAPPQFIPGNQVWIYEGDAPINITPTRIWRIEKWPVPWTLNI